MEIMMKRRSAARKVSATKMSVGERQSLQQEKAELEQHMNEHNNPSFGTGSQDRELTVSRLKEIKVILDSDADNEAKGRERDRLVKRQEELAHIIKQKVPPYSIQNAKAGSPEYQKAMEWGEEASKPETVQMCGEYQNISRMLDPHNPNAGDIEALTASS